MKHFFFNNHIWSDNINGKNLNGFSFCIRQIAGPDPPPSLVCGRRSRAYSSLHFVVPYPSNCCSIMQTKKTCQKIKKIVEFKKDFFNPSVRHFSIIGTNSIKDYFITKIVDIPQFSSCTSILKPKILRHYFLVCYQDVVGVG